MIMTFEKFEALREEFMAREDELLKSKRKEYSVADDRLENIRMIAGLLGMDMPLVALVYLLKHILSIIVAVRHGKYTWDWEQEGGEGMKQRFADARNYLLLLAACLEEENQGGS